MKGHLVKRRDQGFTLIEILMVLILIAVLAAVALNSFINFKTEAKDAALRSNLASLRAAIAAQYSQMQLRCGSSAGKFPTIASIEANDVTNNYQAADPSAVASPLLHNGCDPDPATGEVKVLSERTFVQGGIPANPWAPTADATPNDIIPCSAGDGCTKVKACDGTTTYTDNWCYNEATGEIWSDSDPAGADNPKNRETW